MMGYRKGNNKTTDWFFIKTVLFIDGIFIFFYLLFTYNPALTEKLYSRGLYPHLAFFMGKLFDPVFFSVTEVLLVGSGLFLSVRLFMGIIRFKNEKRSKLPLLKRFVLTCFVLVSLVLNWFYWMWGFNYYRPPLKITEKNTPASPEAEDEYFEQLLFFLINRANTLYSGQPPHREQINREVNRNIHTTLEQISDLSMFPAGRIKQSAAGFLYRTNTLGVISPFLIEGHVSKKIFDSEFPFTIAHEKAHLYGYANEMEANFIAFLTCLNSGDTYVQYSGYVEILSYFLYEYRKTHTADEYKKLYLRVRPEIREEYKQQYERFKKHTGKLNDCFRDLYDFYLKANKVAGGKKSYSMVVSLVLKSEHIQKKMAEAEMIEAGR